MQSVGFADRLDAAQGTSFAVGYAKFRHGPPIVRMPLNIRDACIIVAGNAIAGVSQGLVANSFMKGRIQS